MENTGNEYRLKKIGEIQKQLEAEKEKRTQLGKKYRRSIKAVNAADYILATSIMGLSVVGLSLLATVIAAPAVITTEAVTMGAGMLFIVCRQVNRKLTVKAKKHEKLKVLAEQTLNQISDVVSKALNDDKISDEEFSLILSEVASFQETREKLRKTPSSDDEPFLPKIAFKKRQDSTKNAFKTVL